MFPPQSSPTSSSSSQSNEAVIIFDWDDTILPSSFVDKCQADNVNELPQYFRGLFREIEICTETCLAEAAKHGEVIIITNSDEGWVKYSAERYLPNLIPILKNYRVISARTQYEKFYPNQPLCWKAAAFAHEVNEHFCLLEEAHSLLDRECSHAGMMMMNNNSNNNNILRNAVSDNSSQDDSIPDMDLASTDESSLEEDEDRSIESSSPESPPRGGSSWRTTESSSSTTTITPPRQGGGGGGGRPFAAIRREVISFGDSIEERTAVKIVSDQLDALPKSVKFIYSPTPMQIIGQLTMLTHHMKFVCDHDEELDLEITARQAEKCANGYLTKRGMMLFPSTSRRMGSSMDPPASATGDASMDVSDL